LHNPHCSNQNHARNLHDNLPPKSPLPIKNTLIPVTGGNNIPVPNPLATIPTYNKHHIVLVRHKGDMTKTKQSKQFCIPSSNDAPHFSPRSINQKGHIMMDHPMHHRPNVNPTPTNSTPPASMMASICHTNNVKTPTPQQYPPTCPKPTTSSATIPCHQHSANTATQQIQDNEGIPSGNNSSCNHPEPSFSTP